MTRLLFLIIQKYRQNYFTGVSSVTEKINFFKCSPWRNSDSFDSLKSKIATHLYS